MTEVNPREPKAAVESQHGGTAHYVQSVPVHEKHDGETVWEGSVSVFDLKGSSSGAERAYAWLYELPAGKRRFFAVLGVPLINGPVDAVRAAIVAEAQAK